MAFELIKRIFRLNKLPTLVTFVSAIIAFALSLVVLLSNGTAGQLSQYNMMMVRSYVPPSHYQNHLTTTQAQHLHPPAKRRQSRKRRLNNRQAGRSPPRHSPSQSRRALRSRRTRPHLGCIDFLRRPQSYGNFRARCLRHSRLRGSNICDWQRARQPRNPRRAGGREGRERGGRGRARYARDPAVLHAVHDGVLRREIRAELRGSKRQDERHVVHEIL